MSRAEYPLHSQQDVYQSGELWAIRGSLSEINDPEITVLLATPLGVGWQCGCLLWKWAILQVL
ncbi:MAG: hypothetical protein Ct9H300mP4_16420 [Gammaproteobacteria bacterium]|nr:MAG: hypothetical protein Ct9H300mP4_16420 [Gammaproteobacteria bacterium]